MDETRLEPDKVTTHTEAAANAKRPVLSIIAGWGRDLFISVILAILVILFLYQPVKVEGTSMMPSLVDQERIFINKFVYRFGLGNIERGDMVVFWFPGDPTKSYIKRVIGLPGDTVEVETGRCSSTAGRLARAMFLTSTATIRSIRSTRSARTSTLCSATTEARRTTAAPGARYRGSTSTAKRSSCTGLCKRSAC